MPPQNLLQVSVKQIGSQPRVSRSSSSQDESAGFPPSYARKQEAQNPHCISPLAKWETKRGSISSRASSRRRGHAALPRVARITQQIPDLRITITNSVLVQLTLVLKADIFCWWTQSSARLLTPVLEEQGLVLTCRMGADPMELLVRTILTVSVAL